MVPKWHFWDFSRKVRCHKQMRVACGKLSSFARAARAEMPGTPSSTSFFHARCDGRSVHLTTTFKVQNAKK